MAPRAVKLFDDMSKDTSSLRSILQRCAQKSEKNQQSSSSGSSSFGGGSGSKRKKQPKACLRQVSPGAKAATPVSEMSQLHRERTSSAGQRCSKSDTDAQVASPAIV